MTEELLTRLRTLESECIRLLALDLPLDLKRAESIYQERLKHLEQSHSHSWFGDHSTTYYNNFETPPGGESFNVEWGFVPGYNGSRNRGWQVYSREEVRSFVFADIGENIFYELSALANRIIDEFKILKNQATDVLEVLTDQLDSKALIRYTAAIQEIRPYEAIDYINARLKSAPRMTRDSQEIAKGQAAPVHVHCIALSETIPINKKKLQDLSVILRNSIEAAMLVQPKRAATNIMKRVFIGHGRSEQWRVLKDFIRDRLHLDYEEFNRISPAGINTQERLAEMLDKCGFAFLVMAAEDLHADGLLHARENVIHEAGLFQGRLGWRKAIILLEDECEEFSNIAGLGQIRFAKANISSCFEDVRRVLEREEVL
jgi:predicted nucleotide-binding protein